MTDKIPVSVIVMTLNEELNIVNCLKSLARFDEVFVVDSNSTDRTCEIAAGNGRQTGQLHLEPAVSA